jgi:H-type lectin domain
VEVGFLTSNIGGYLQTWSNHPLLFATNDGFAAMILGTNGNLGIGTLSSFNNTHRLRVNGETYLSGRVGIGAAPTNEMLHVAGSATIDALKVVSTLNAGGTEVSSIKIGTIGTTISAFQHGTLTVGPGATQQIVATLVFPSSFASIPRLFVMPKHQPGFINNDAFSVTIKTISTTQATLVIRRLDSNAAWDQNLVIDWLAIR